MRRVREICDEFATLLVADEVMTDRGRTGKWFGVDNWGVVPDVMTMAKGVTQGYMPLGAVVISQKIADYYDQNMFWYGLTYSGHPLSCAAGIAPPLAINRIINILFDTIGQGRI